MYGIVEGDAYIRINTKTTFQIKIKSSFKTEAQF